MAEFAVEITGVTKIFGENTDNEVIALDKVSVNISDNEFFTLLGPSGCGKTTLLRLVAGFEYQSRGEILLFGESLHGLPPQNRPVNTVFQHYALFPHMTIAQNVGFPLKMSNWDEKEISNTVEEKLALVKMEAFTDRYPAQLSGGQQQRVALARALAPKPKVLLLDEPLSALDLKLREQMRTELKLLQRETGITFIFVTHDQVEALTMSDRIAVMSVGKLQQIGTPIEIYEQPTNRFVADFIGETNFIEATISKINAESVSCQIGDNIEIGVAEAYKKSVGDRVTLALRPEKIILEPVNEGATKGFTGKIIDSVYIGTDTTYHIALGEDTVIAARGQNTITGESRFKVGEMITVKVGRGAARVLVD